MQAAEKSGIQVKRTAAGQMAVIIVIVLLAVTAVHCPAQWLAGQSGVSEELHDIVMLGIDEAVAVGYEGSVLRTATGGETWTVVHSEVDVSLNAVAFRGREGVVVGERGTILRSSDDGLSWSPLQFAPTADLLCAAFSPDGRLWTASRTGMLYVSADLGNSWDSLDVAGGSITSVFFHSTREGQTKGYLVEGWYAWHSSGDLSVWERQQLPMTNWGVAVAGDASALGAVSFIVGSDGPVGVYPRVFGRRSADSTWRNIDLGTGDMGMLEDITVADHLTAYTCGMSEDIYRTSDSGEHWQRQHHSGLSYLVLRGIDSFDDNHVIAVGDSGRILYTRNGGVTTVEFPTPGAVRSLALHGNYPNPFSVSTGIRFSLREAAPVMVEIISLTGKVVARIDAGRRSPGEHSVRWETGGRQGGLYLYRIIAGYESRTGKMLLINHNR